jgi:hypothetical protein
MFCQPDEHAPERTVASSVSLKPALVAFIVAWMLSLARLVLAFVRVELSADTLLALVFFCGLPMVGLAFWLREQRTPRRRAASPIVSTPYVRSTHIRLVSPSPAKRARKRPSDPNGTRAA